MKKKINFRTLSFMTRFFLWHVSTAWRGSIELMLKSIDLTHPQFVILATLGWLTRKGDRVTSDGRTKKLILTIKGSNIIKKAMPPVETKESEFFHYLTAEEIECMISIFQKLIPKHAKVVE